MSKLEVREIGPISGETEVRLADGATAVGFGGGGKILQVVQTIKSDIFSLTNNSGVFVDVIGLSASITPSSSNSKILVSSTINGTSSGRYNAFRLLRDSTFIFPAPTEGNRTSVTTNFESNHSESDQIFILRNTSFAFLDAPATSSQINYKIQATSDTRTTANENFILYVNRQASDDNADFTHRAVSSIILMEVAG